jgi:hypothetical protein
LVLVHVEPVLPLGFVQGIHGKIGNDFRLRRFAICGLSRFVGFQVHAGALHDLLLQTLCFKARHIETCFRKGEVVYRNTANDSVPGTVGEGYFGSGFAGISLATFGL